MFEKSIATSLAGIPPCDSSGADIVSSFRFSGSIERFRNSTGRQAVVEMVMMFLPQGPGIVVVVQGMVGLV
jgi:hypothetical protein